MRTQTGAQQKRAKHHRLKIILSFAIAATYPGRVCHVEKIIVKGQDLNCILPPSLAKLPYINNIDLTHNYLRGNISLEWASTKLEYLCVIINRLSGTIPKYLGDITTLTYMILLSKRLSGRLPMTFAGLTNLTDFRISDNSFSGPIPEFIQSWNQLQRLHIGASGLEGPIPSNLSLLGKLTDFRKFIGSTLIFLKKMIMKWT